MIEPTDKKPIEFIILIVLLLSGVPESIYAVLVGESEYPVISLISCAIFILWGVGLWKRKEIARRILIELTSLLILPFGLLMFFILGGVSKGDINLTDAIPSALMVVALIVTVFYLRSDRLLRYYWAEKLREENT